MKIYAVSALSLEQSYSTFSVVLRTVVVYYVSRISNVARVSLSLSLERAPVGGRRFRPSVAVVSGCHFRPSLGRVKLRFFEFLLYAAV